MEELWQIEANGYIGLLRIARDANGLRGTVTFDIEGVPESLEQFQLIDGIISFRRNHQTYSGVTSSDRIIGTFTIDGSPVVHSWQATRTSSDEGLIELGDINGDGVVDNQDIVHFINSFGIRITTYRVCDDDFNPGCFGLLETQARPGGLAKAIDRACYADFGIAPAPYPPRRLPSIRDTGYVLWRYPRDLVGAAFRNQNWSIDFSGFVRGDGLSTNSSWWRITANGHAGFLMIWRNGPAARVRFGNGPYEALTDVQVIRDPTLPSNSLPITLIFHRRLGSTVQRYVGQFGGLSGGGLVGREVRGAFSDDSGTFTWQALGEINLRRESVLDMVANGVAGRLRLRLDDSFSGRMVFTNDEFADLSLWERIDYVEDGRDGNLSFRRPNANQSYRGRITGDNITGTFTERNTEYNWTGERVMFAAGTAQGGCLERPGWEVGRVCNTVWLGLQAPSRTISQESVSHPLEWALARGDAPFTVVDRHRYREMFRQNATAQLTRPGFVSDYAAQDKEFSHDIVETMDFYAVEPGTLWGQNVSSAPVVGPVGAWPAELVGVAQPATRWKQGR